LTAAAAGEAAWFGGAKRVAEPGCERSERRILADARSVSARISKYAVNLLLRLFYLGFNAPNPGDDAFLRNSQFDKFEQARTEDQKAGQGDDCNHERCWRVRHQ
jgi:hypothetical protein